MKTFHFITICLFITSNFLYSQDIQEVKNDYKTDTLKAKHFGNLIKPIDENGVIFKEKKNGESAYFKKCAYLKISDERNKCFSKTFYEVLRKNISFNTQLLKEKDIDILVRFTINKMGKIENIMFPKSNDPTGEFEKEIIRVLNKLPKIIPAKENDIFINSTYNFPIGFKKN